MAAVHDQENPPAAAAAVVVVVVPFLFQSHLNQALQLAHLISSYKIPVYYATSAAHCRQAKLRYNGKNTSSITHLNFIELPMPPFLSPPPNPNSTLKFPSHLQPCLDVCLELRHPTAALLRQLSSSSKRVVVINDTNMAYVTQDVATIPNAESYSFSCISAFSLHCIINQGILDEYKTNVDRIYLKPIAETVTPEILKFAAYQSPHEDLKSGDLINTCRTLERSYLDLLKDKKQWAVAPLNPVIRATDEMINNNTCLLWLDKQPRKSVLFVSFGSTTSMMDEQVKELAMGLRQSKQRFLWVFRDAERGNAFSDDNGDRKSGLPDGFEESVEGIGMVTRDWAPQVEILGHGSVGAFMSHCGWNSCMESLSMGVPIVAWPMHSEQPYNALLVTEMLKAGVAIKECDGDLVGSDLIKEAIEEMMVSDEGVIKRERAEEIGLVLRNAVEEGGATRLEMDSFVEHITR
ncbi:zeatin O-glucosyltransferase-like [Impatiens glandulifera]|uniref:zeatin O-glucosyltransferase-like n=1 Tax=Impatiens glandulifera TaxID=253017 RepID=UPI001FB18981|nr:zeatin O-glucosyltransferase-like [Impatiens glandulifera]